MERDNEKKKYVRLFLCFAPGAAAIIEFILFWVKNGGLHVSRLDFWSAHPVHCLVSLSVMGISLLALNIEHRYQRKKEDGNDAG